MGGLAKAKAPKKAKKEKVDGTGHRGSFRLDSFHACIANAAIPVNKKHAPMPLQAPLLQSSRWCPAPAVVAVVVAIGFWSSSDDRLSIGVGVGIGIGGAALGRTSR